MRPSDAIAGKRERECGEKLEPVLVHRRVDELPRVLEQDPAPALRETALDGLKPKSERLQRLDGKPAFEGPLPERDAMPGGERGVELHRVVDAEIGQPWPNPRLVDDAVPLVPAVERNMGLERGLDELRIGDAPAESGENPYVTPFD
jgi:hypothetical protein